MAATQSINYTDDLYLWFCFYAITKIIDINKNKIGQGGLWGGGSPLKIVPCFPSKKAVNFFN